MRRHANCSVQLYCRLYLQGTARWHKEFVWFIYPPKDGAHNCSKHLEFSDQTFLLWDFSGLFFKVSGFKEIRLLCLSCIRKGWVSLQKDNFRIISTGTKFWPMFHQNVPRIPIEVHSRFQREAFYDVRPWNCNIYKGHYANLETCVYFTMSKVLNLTTRPYLSIFATAYKNGLVNFQQQLYYPPNKPEVLSYGLNTRTFAFILMLENQIFTLSLRSHSTGKFGCTC